VYNGQETIITPTISSFEVDLAYQVIAFNANKTIEKIYGFGRDGNFFVNLKNKFLTIFFNNQAKLIYGLNENEIRKILKSSYANFDRPAQNAKLVLNPKKSDNQNFAFEIEEEKLGKILDYDRAIAELKSKLEKSDFSPILLQSKTDYPTIHKNEGLNIEASANKILSAAPLSLTYKNEKWLVDQETIAEWLALKRANGDSKNKNNGSIIVTLDPEKFAKFLEEKIALKIDKEPVDARFEIKEGKVVEFQQSQDGLRLQMDESLKKVEENFIFNNINEVELAVAEEKSNLTAGNLNDFGINEIVGTGHSNFAGSPTNRRHNIKVGADSINGLLIEPSKEFSLIAALGEIEKETGYLPELVIKGNKTIPEYGGGLCQIGTTVFRTATASGLPITMRRNHSYRVSYYEPAGTDATIYDPMPDFRFVNDTNHHLLIQTRIEGDDLYFDFWGTKDGRIVEKTEPTIYNIVKPGPTKIIETLDLKPGEKKCTEKAHNGADAYFDYKVTYPSVADASPEIKETRFTSHYIPWQEVCLLGVEKIATSTSENNLIQ